MRSSFWASPTTSSPPSPPGPTSYISRVTEVIDFVASPAAFVAARVAAYGGTFSTYFPSLHASLSGHTVFATSHAAALQVLSAPPAHASAPHAFAEYLTPLYRASSVLLTTSAAAHASYRALDSALDPALYQAAIAAVIDGHIAAVAPGPFDSYAFAKHLFSDLTAVLFLGDAYPLPGSAAPSTAALRSLHFQATVAPPVSISIPALNISSARARGLAARNAIEARVHARLLARRAAKHPPAATTVLEAFGDSSTPLPPTALAQHLTVLANAASSKSCASTLLYLILEVASLSGAQALLASPSGGRRFLSACLMETLRLHPPLLGSMRRALGDFVVDGKTVGAGVRVFAGFRSANLDEAVYEEPHVFRPERWTGTDGGQCPFVGKTGAGVPPHPLTFGAGERVCPGRGLAWDMVMLAAERLFGEYEVAMPAEGVPVAEFEERFFPVLRPKVTPTLTLRRKE